MNLRLQTESWIWYTVAVGMVLARLISRKLLFSSIRHLQSDDILMAVLVIPFYTTLIVCANLQYRQGTNLLPPDYDYTTLTYTDINRRIHGSKLVVVVEQMQILVIWTCKVCLLIMYRRLTETCAPKAYIAIKILALYTALGFAVMETLYFTAWCRPLHDYWAVPSHNPQCNALIDHRITNAVFNISSDLAMLCIAIPLFIRSLLPLKRKLVLCGIFGLGIFVVLAAVLNKYYSFVKPYKQDWVFWYIRESSTAILVANVPFTWTLLREMFDVGDFEGNPEPWTFHSARTASGRNQRVQKHGRMPSSNDHTATTSHLSGSKFSGDRTLVGSLIVPREDCEQVDHVEASRDSRKGSRGSNDFHGLFEETEAQPHDSSTPSPEAIARNIDLERGHDYLEGESDSEMAMYRAVLRATSPSRAQRPPEAASTKTNSHISRPDGTGGYLKGLRGPRAAHLATSSRHSGIHLRASSRSSRHQPNVCYLPALSASSSFADDGPSPFITATFGDGKSISKV